MRAWIFFKKIRLENENEQNDRVIPWIYVLDVIEQQRPDFVFEKDTHGNPLTSTAICYRRNEVEQKR